SKSHAITSKPWPHRSEPASANAPWLCEASYARSSVASSSLPSSHVSTIGAHAITAEPSLVNAPMQSDCVPSSVTSARHSYSSASPPPGTLSDLPLVSPGELTFEPMPFEVAFDGFDVSFFGSFGPAFLAWLPVLELPPQATRGSTSEDRRTILYIASSFCG